MQPKLSPTIHVVIADDHTIFRAGVKTLLEEEPDIEVVGEAEDGQGLRDFVERQKADILLLDLDMPGTNGHEVLRQLKNARSRVRTVVLSASENRMELSLALELGAQGIVSKSTATRRLVDAIRQVRNGGMWVDPTFPNLAECVPSTKKSRRRLLHQGPPEDLNADWNSLTPRERQIASLVAKGMRYKQIGRQLVISEQTVRNHLRNIFDKLQINDRVHLALYTLHRNS